MSLIEVNVQMFPIIEYLYAEGAVLLPLCEQELLIQ